MDGSLVDFVTGVMLFPSEALGLYAVSVNDRHARKTANKSINVRREPGPLGCAIEIPRGTGEPARKVWRAHPPEVKSRPPAWVGQLGVRERGCLRATLAHPVGELHNASLVLALGAELVAGEEPLGGLSGAAGLDVGGLLAGLPTAGKHHGALDGGALLAVDVLGIAQT